jgi:hypothetical protein
MKVTVVPAQVTTVEDRIAGNLGLSQLLLLTAPVFIGSLLFVILPPLFHLAIYKILLVFALFFVCSTLAIRIKGKIILLWLIVLIRYNVRPRYYVFNKQSIHGREMYLAKNVEVVKEEVKKSQREHKKISLTVAEMAKLYELLDNPAANVAFENRKGGLYVRLTEVKQEG